MAQITLHDYLQEIEEALSAKRTEDALNKCMRTLEYFPESLEAQRLLGEVHLAKGHMEEAQQAFDWVLTNDPENVIAYCNRALISERQSDYDTALDCYQQAYELSRGNSQIREEFNALSTKAGQQGFMFSRAGLARLYMRGDLLSQAIQEWEIVLSTTPDRLDARVGLLETYWREGSFDRVDELARQILHDIPSCLKALLLQAYVLSPKDMLEAQDIIRRAETLDPDMQMAQELFNDLFASQPTNPFLKLLKKAPATLDTTNGKLPVPTPAMPDYTALAPENTAGGLNVKASEVLAGWSQFDDWNGIDTFKPLPPAQLPQIEEAASAFSAWASDPSLATWNAPSPQTQHQPSGPQIPVQPGTFAGNTNVEAWETPDRNANQQLAPWQVPQQNAAPTPDGSAYAEPSFDEAENWSSFGDLQGNEVNSTWSSGPSSQDEKPSAAPAWLSMLTQSDQRQATSNPRMPAMPAEPKPAPAQPSQPIARITPEPAAAPPMAPWDDDAGIMQFSPDSEDSFSFGPEWLKAIGATTIDSDNHAKAEPVAPTVTPPPAAPAPTPQPAFDASPKGQTGEQILATLEHLEKDLRAQGFMPHEPNTLSALAHAPAAPPLPPTREPEPVAQQEQPAYEYSDLTSALAHQREALSSALEQLGNLQQYSQPASPAPSQPAWSMPAEAAPTTSPAPISEPEPTFPSEEPAWVAALRAVPTPAPVQQPQPQPQPQPMYPATPPLHEPQPMYPVMPPTYPTRMEPPAQPPKQPAPLAPAAHVDSYPGPVYQPAPAAPAIPVTVPNLPPATEAVPAYAALSQRIPDSEAPENELEVTMKRPALRLPLGPQSSQTPDVITTPGKARSTTPKPADTNLGPQERLLQGYQHQLVGDYDEAMQEYRIIIRNAPEMLVEVINNVKALLKLAPRYSAGYRVLGDAYMRQGEYLQAMEAYNKALTMAKKAKG